MSARTIWPIAVSYWELVRVIVAWCELRKAFRSFRTDRVRAADFLTERYPTPRTRLTAQWRKEMAEAVRTREDMLPTAREDGVALLHPRRPLAGILAQPGIDY